MDPARAARSPIVFLVAAVLFINYVDRGALPTAAHLMQGDLRLNYTQMGMLMSAFFWTYTFSQIPVGWLAERYGAHRILAAGLTLWASATILVGFVHTFAMLLVLRLLLGLGESAGFPCAAKILAAIVPAKGLGTANGIVALGYLSGPVVGTIVGGLLMAHFGWRSAFWVFGALSLLWLWPWSRVAGGVRAANSSPWYRRVSVPATVPAANPPRPLVTIHSRAWATARSPHSARSSSNDGIADPHALRFVAAPRFLRSGPRTSRGAQAPVHRRGIPAA